MSKHQRERERENKKQSEYSLDTLVSIEQSVVVMMVVVSIVDARIKGDYSQKIHNAKIGK